MHYKIEIEFDSDIVLPINEDSHTKQVMDTRVQMEAAEMVLTKMGLPGYNLSATMNMEEGVEQ